MYTVGIYLIYTYMHPQIRMLFDSVWIMEIIAVKARK